LNTVIEFPLHVEQSLADLLSGRVLNVNAVAGDLDTDSKLLLVRREEGLLRIV
jgi:hypothetical protein